MKKRISTVNNARALEANALKINLLLLVVLLGVLAALVITRTGARIPEPGTQNKQTIYVTY